jgi:putative hemolysin
MPVFVVEILLILLLIVANGVFSGSEIAIVSARKVRLEQLAKQGNNKAKLALKLANSPNNFLSTVQIGITLIGILSGAVGGATTAGRLEAYLNTIPTLAPYSQPLSLVVVVGLITYLSLVIGELVPKRVALSNPEQLACVVAGPMRLLSTITAPIVHLLSGSTDLLLNLLGIRGGEEQALTEEEIKVLIEQGTETGIFEEAEQEMVSRVFRLGDRPIRAFMTPRTEIDWLDIGDSFEVNRQILIDSTHSRFPVCRDSIDECLGFVRVKSVLSAYLSGEPIDWEAIALAPMYIADGTKALKVLELFKESGSHIALVTDEYGGVQGLVTIKDLMEAIVGELPSSENREEPMVIQREDGSWLLDGLLSTDELKALFDKETLPEEKSNYHTLGGLIITCIGKIPQSGDHFEWQGLRFEVMDMDGTRVDKVLVSVVGKATPPEEEES